MFHPALSTLRRPCAGLLLAFAFVFALGATADALAQTFSPAGTGVGILPSPQMAPPARMRGVQLAEDQNWADPAFAGWNNVAQLPSWGANVVRIPLEPFADGQPLLPGQPLAARTAKALERFTGVIDWALQNNLYVVLTVNPYYVYPPPAANWPDDGRSLWKDLSAQDELVATWAMLAQRYQGMPGLIFDLVNEPHGLSTDEVANNQALPKQVWNALYPRIAQTILGIDAGRRMIVEPIWADAGYLADLGVAQLPNLLFSFHFFTPQSFTLQGASTEFGTGGGTVVYPGMAQASASEPAQYWDKTALAGRMQPAADFQQRTGARVVLGAFGTFSAAPIDSRQAWTADVLDLAEGYGFDLIDFRYEAGAGGGWSFEGTPLQSLLTPVFAKNILAPADATPLVVEFYNPDLDNFFITANAVEQAAVAGGAAGASWIETGGGFKAGGASQVCRFYGSLSPGPNSHFYTIDPDECQALKVLQATTPATQKRWNFESLDFGSTVPASGACPDGKVPVYRAYNNGFTRGVDSNHRITSNYAAYQAQLRKGWIGEGVVMCAPD